MKWSQYSGRRPVFYPRTAKKGGRFRVFTLSARLVAGDCNVPNVLTLPFRLELNRVAT